MPTEKYITLFVQLQCNVSTRETDLASTLTTSNEISQSVNWLQPQVSNSLRGLINRLLVVNVLAKTWSNTFQIGNVFADLPD